MRRTFWTKALVLAGALAVVLAVIWTFRTGVVRFVANRVLAENAIVLSRLDELQINSHRTTAARMELQLSGGQRLALSDIVLGYRFTSFTQAPLVESIEIGAAQLLPAIDSANPATTDDADNEPLLLSDVLQVLRELPLTAVTVTTLSLPNYDKALALDLRLNDGELIVRVDNSDLQFLVSFVQADAAATALLKVTLMRGSETVGNLNVSLLPSQQTYALQGNGHLQFADLNTLLGQLQQAPLALPLKSANLDWTLAGAVADDFTGTFAAGIAEPATFTLGIAAGSQFALALPDSGVDELSVNLKDRADFVVNTGADARISRGSLAVQAKGQWNASPFSFDSALSLTDCSTALCHLGFKGVANYDTYSVAGVIDVDAMQSANGEAQYHVKTTDLSLGGLDQWIPPFDIDAQLGLTDDRLTFKTPLRLRNAPGDAGITTSGTYEFPTGVLTAQFEAPSLEFSEQGHALSNWLSGWPYSFDVLSGTLSAQANVVWDSKGANTTADATRLLKVDFELNASNLGGFYDDIFFRGLSSNPVGSIDTGAEFPLETPDIAVTLDGIDVGVPIDNITLNFAFDADAQQLLVNSLSGELLGGTIGSDSFRYEFGAERNDITLQFHSLRIERMMELADYDGVQASGAVSGELPLTLTQGRVEIGAGTLHADAPGGNIRYLSTVGSAGDPGIDLVNQALANYQYDSLTSSIVYSPAGELMLGMQLQGTNPEMSKDQRINLNLNLTDNIPALLKSLQAARQIEDFLQQQYQ